MISVKIADPLSTAEKNHELFLGWEEGREVVGWKTRWISTCLLAADGGEKFTSENYMCMYMTLNIK